MSSEYSGRSIENKNYESVESTEKGLSESSALGFELKASQELARFEERSAAGLATIENQAERLGIGQKELEDILQKLGVRERLKELQNKAEDIYQKCTVATKKAVSTAVMAGLLTQAIFQDREVVYAHEQDREKQEKVEKKEEVKYVSEKEIIESVLKMDHERQFLQIDKAERFIQLEEGKSDFIPIESIFASFDKYVSAKDKQVSYIHTHPEHMIRGDIVKYLGSHHSSIENHTVPLSPSSLDFSCHVKIENLLKKQGKKAEFTSKVYGPSGVFTIEKIDPKFAELITEYEKLSQKVIPDFLRSLPKKYQVEARAIVENPDMHPVKRLYKLADHPEIGPLVETFVEKFQLKTKRFEKVIAFMAEAENSADVLLGTGIGEGVYKGDSIEDAISDYIDECGRYGVTVSYKAYSEE